MNEQKLASGKLWILLGALAIMIFVIIAAISQILKSGMGGSGSVQAPVVSSQNSAAITPGEVAPSKSVTPTATVTPEVLQTAAAIATGTSLITANNIVVTPQGVPVKLNVIPSAQDAPKESAPLTPGSIPVSASDVKVSVSNAGFVPATFTVKEGQLVNFILTSTDQYTHVWLLNDPSLIATALGVAGHETRVKSWNAPKKGSYVFHDDVIGHNNIVGTMIVN